MNTLSIIIVNWNSGTHLLNCINSILKCNKNEFKLDKIIIVDNASTDNSIELIVENSLINIIKNNTNLGFAKACCIGAEICNSDIFLFLNPDTIILDETLDKSVSFYREKSALLNFGILGIQLKDENKVIQKSCSRFPNIITYLSDSSGISKFISFSSTHMRDFNHQESRFVDHVIGAYYMLSKDIYKRLNGFDNSFFVYFEDLDLSLRARKLGINSYYWVGAHAIHIGGGCSNSVKAQRLFFSIRSRMIYTKKHFSLISHYITSFLTLCIEPLTRIIFCTIKRDYKGIFETLSGYKMIFLNLRNDK
ncbi:MAG TPA: glycosyltransferase family 2 protein [Burkholderiales bacterium]|nr:glycosyltransferase family 2 protein [Burkholderiales bacterium]